MGAIGCSAVLAARRLSAVTYRNLVDNYSGMLAASATHISYLQREIQRTGRIVLGNSELQALLSSREPEDTYRMFRRQEQVKRILREHCQSVDGIIGIDVLLADGRTFTSNAGNIPFITQQPARWEDLGRLELEGGAYFSGPHTLDKGVATQRAITWISPLNNYFLLEQRYATVFIHVESRLFFSEAFGNLPEGEWLLVRSLDGELLYREGLLPEDPGEGGLPEPLSPGEGRRVLRREGRILFGNGELEDGWSIHLAVSDRWIVSQAREVYGYFTLVALLAAGTAAAVLVLFLTRATRPIKDLTAAAREISGGNLEVAVPTGSRDELGMLSTVFNEMAAGLRSHIRNLLAFEKQKSRLRLELLMAQINPHFIYNTLNSIIYLISMKRNGDAVRLSRSFVRLLQDNLRTGADGVAATVRQELGCVRDYLEIQSIRYPGRFAMMEEVDPEALDHSVPRMLLQPVVENSLYHGILPLERKGNIRLGIRTVGGYLELLVGDDGQGMDGEALRRLNLGEGNGSARVHSIGFDNIRQRLRLIYRGKESLTVESKPGKGTLVTIRLPLRFDGDGEEPSADPFLE